jgi:hypothetical protein
MVLAHRKLELRHFRQEFPALSAGSKLEAECRWLGGLSRLLRASGRFSSRRITSYETKAVPGISTAVVSAASAETATPPAEAAGPAAIEAAAVERRCRHPRSGAELLRSHEAPLCLALEPLDLWRVTILRQRPIALRLVLESLNLRLCPILRR